MTPRDSYDALIGRILEFATAGICGKGKLPKNTKERELVTRAVTQIIDNAQIFHIDPNFHPKQDWFLRSPGDIVVACTGNKFGKTFALLLTGIIPTLHCVPWAPREEQDEQYEIYSKVKLKYEPPIEVVLAGPDFTGWLPMNIIPRLKKLIPWEVLITRTNRVQGNVIDGLEWWNGSTWKILSYAGEDDRFESWSAHVILWDEPPPHRKFVGACRGAVEFGAKHIMSYTPENLKDAFTYDEIYDPGYHIATQEDFERAINEKDLIEDRHRGIAVIEGSIHDNPYIEDKDRARQIKRWSQEEREAREWGRYRHWFGRVFKGFSREHHVRELDQVV